MKIIFKTILLWLVCSVSVCAEQALELVNGDRISGEIIKVESGTVFFHSALLGDLQLPKDSIKTKLDTHTPAAPALSPMVNAPQAPSPQNAPPEVAVVGVPIPPKVEPKPEEKAEFDLRKALHIPKNLKGQIKLSAYHRKDTYSEDYYNLSPSLSWKKDKHAFNWNFSHRYRRNDKLGDGIWTKQDDRITAEQKYRYNLDKSIFSQSRTYWEKDLVDEIDPRFIQSAGLGLYVLNSKTLKLDFSPGVGYEYVENTGEVTQSITPTFEQTFEWVISSRFSFKQNFTFVGDDVEYQYDLINELAAKLNGSLSLVLKHSVEFELEVSDGVEDESRDVRTTASVQLSF